MANIFMGFFSGYAGAGSFARSAVNFDNGARTRMSSIFSALFVLVAMITLGSFGTYLPRSALSAVILITAYGMIDRAELKRIWHGHRGDAAIMVVTLLGTLFLDMTFAVLLGILLSFVLYILRTSTPQVYAVLPDLHFNHFSHQPDRQPCLQLGIIEILGDLYFGAVNHVEEFILNHADTHPEQRFLLLRLHHVNNCDFSGVHMLENVVKVYRDRGGDVFLVKPNTHLVQLFQATGFAEMVLGDDHILDEDTAISQLFHHVLDPAICIYECPTKVFKECMNLPKRMNFAGIPHDHDVSAEQVMLISPRELWFDLHPQGVATAVAEAKLPLVIDVREPREFRQAHIPEATLIPLSTILSQEVKLPADRPIVLVCRSGRRSRRAAVALQGVGCMNVSVLAGGMLAWEAAALLEAVGD
jgi:SulP family sulfate permease